MTPDCPDELFDKMKKNCAKHIKVCKEINISFLPQEAQVSTSENSRSLDWRGVLLLMTVFYGSPVQVFTCDNPEAFKSIYNPNSQDRDRTLGMIADQIVTLCATLDEYPGVRYKKYRHSYSLHLCSDYTWCDAWMDIESLSSSSCVEIRLSNTESGWLNLWIINWRDITSWMTTPKIRWGLISAYLNKYYLCTYNIKVLSLETALYPL